MLVSLHLEFFKALLGPQNRINIQRHFIQRQRQEAFFGFYLCPFSFASSVKITAASSIITKEHKHKKATAYFNKILIIYILRNQSICGF